MKVLLLEFDLYKSVGGGQTVYRRLIETNPQIEFYYLGRTEPGAATRPPNARMIPFKETYEARLLSGEFSDLNITLWGYLNFLESANIAACVSHVQFDVVDIPDYRVLGYLMGPALRRHGQKNCKVVLALHGNLSETQRVNWGSRPWIDVSSDQREQWQYRVADIRYGLSRDYLEHWQRIGRIAGHYINPLRFVEPAKPVKWDHSNEGIALNFIGRTEGFKGPDLFIELLAWLPAGSYREAGIIGPSIVDWSGVDSQQHLARMAAYRGLTVKHHGCMNKQQLMQLYGTRSVTVLPSRMDTFNLTALESLQAGCPVAVSDKAGVCRFMRDTYPEVPFTTLDVDNLYAGAPALLRVIREYDRHREALVEAISRAAPVIDGQTLAEIYGGDVASDDFLRHQADQMFDRLLLFHQQQRTPAYERLSTLGVRVCDALRSSKSAAKPRRGPIQEVDLWSRYRQLFYMPETGEEELDAKVAYAGDIANGARIDRARVWAELARLERMRGNDFVAATYDVRVMRATGGDRLGMLPLVVATLNAHGYPREAETVVALYGPEQQRYERCRALLESARTAQLSVADRPFEFLEDGRGESKPRISIIVSLYRAANKLETFLRMLSHQPLVASGEIELVFVDSQSPTDERAVYSRLAGALRIKAVYARTAERETIQKAWNRGILLARAPYLAFLGVDEMVRPDCFAKLAAELDADPALDWVQGNSVITEVDPHGTLQRDVMVYQRIPYDQDLVYLETCYLSWVGSLYRRDIHDRFGYYDESFGAAGDTEFKNRVLPFIKSKTLPLTLGVFLNYPEERTTQSPKAEIEDLRAWYLHRSEAGVEYALKKRPAAEALTLFQKALCYRKSYCGHLSSDFDFAHAIADYASRGGSSPIPEFAAAAVGRVLRAYRDLEWLSELSPQAAVREKKRVEEIAAAEARLVLGHAVAGSRQPWVVFNDNRFEQHSGLWQGKQLVGNHPSGTRYLWCPQTGFTPSDAAVSANSSGALCTPPEAVERFLAKLQQETQDVPAAKLDRDFTLVANVLLDFAAGKNIAPPATAGAAAVLCRVMAESHQTQPFSSGLPFDRKFVELCGRLALCAADDCRALADGFAALAEEVGGGLDRTQSMETTARLMTHPIPAEAVRRHSPELNGEVLDTLKRAADSARQTGNLAYCTRLNAMATAVQGELQIKASRASKMAPVLASR